MPKTTRFCGCPVKGICDCQTFPCRDCGITLQRDECRWGDGVNGPFLIARLCKSCKAQQDAASHAKHRDKRLAAMRAYQQDPDNRDRLLAAKRDYGKSERGREVERRSRNKPEVKARRRNRYLIDRYGITTDDYDRMLAEQDGVCGICRDPEAPRGRGEHFHVDHCHATGQVRGLLCSLCNTALGSFRDDEDRLMKAAEYLSAARGIRGQT